jgi:predicted ATP-grasp superfamily ATP-dependent carboligase
MPPHTTVLQACDKQYTTSLAASLGVRTPQTCFVSSAAEAAQVAGSISYPVVLKARSTNQPGSDGKLRATGKPLYAKNAEEFRSAYADMASRSASVLVQEFVEGVGMGYFALMREGQVRAEFFHLRLRDVRPTGSGSSLRISVEPQPALRDAGLRILQALKWHGVAMVEFRVREDGEPVFMEVNGRFWNSLPLAIHSGVDFPALLAKMAEKGEVEGPSTYRANVRCRWLLGDVRHLVETLAGPPAGFPGKFPKRLQTLFSFIKPVRGTYHDNFSLDDPLPAVGDWLHFATRRIPGLVRKPRPQPANQFLGALHLHSKYSDGEFTLPEIKRIFTEAGCKFACVTDHAEYFDEEKLEYYMMECERLSGNGFKFVPGLEYRCDGGMHILGYGCTALTESTNPEQVIDHIQRHNGIAVIAHPADRMFASIENFSVLPHGIEVWNTKYDGRYAPRTGTFRLLAHLQQRKPELRAFYGTDLHWRRQYRGMYTALASPRSDRAEILDALRRGEYSGTKAELLLPSSGHLDGHLMMRFDLEHRKTDRLKRMAASLKNSAGRMGFSVPPALKAQLRRIF